MNLHVVGLPHTNVVTSESSCAYTQKVRRFCDMMTAKGHTVFLYAPEGPCDVVNAEQVQLGPVSEARDFTVGAPHWDAMNKLAIGQIASRAEPGDVLCLIAGLAQKQIADAFPEMRALEWGIGYGGTFAPHRVFESYAWMHTVYGAQTGGDPHAADGANYDAVIPNCYDPDEFQYESQKSDYLLFMGRLTSRKGLHVVQEIAKRVDRPVIVAGDGPDRSILEDAPNVTMVGPVGPDERAHLMGFARALLAPTVYVEPFGGVAVEAMMSGTPVISSDWGAFTETVQHGETGFRCRTLAEWLKAVDEVADLTPAVIRRYAYRNFSTTRGAELYDAYLRQLASLDGPGWYGTEIYEPAARGSI